VPTIRSFKQKENAPALRPGLIEGGSAIGGWGAGPDPPSVLMFLHCEVSNKRKSVCAVPIHSRFFWSAVPAWADGPRPRGKQLGRPRIAPELEARILTALKASGRTEGVRKIAKRFAVDPGTVQRISRPLESAEAA
jgi:hypothetical protein